MKPVLFVDLDDTLFCSRQNATEVGEPVAFGRGGEPLSRMSSRQRSFFEWLTRESEIVVTTGRSEEAYRRVALPLFGYAICSHGGLVLKPDGRVEPRWRERILEESRTQSAVFSEVQSRLDSWAQRSAADIRWKAVGEGDLLLYFSIKHNRADHGSLAELSGRFSEWLPIGWRILLNGNNLAILPPYLGKEKAVSWFLAEVMSQGAFSMGLGDSLSDAPFMGLCDYALTPSRSQLFSFLLSRIP